MTQLESGKQVVFPCTTERQRDIRPPLLVIDQEEFLGRQYYIAALFVFFI